jgi:hypothetical protein
VHAVAEVDTDVADRAVEEQQVARLCLVPGDVGDRCVLGTGLMGQAHAGLTPRVGGQPRTVEADTRAGGGVAIRHALLAQGRLHRDSRARRHRRRAVAAAGTRRVAGRGRATARGPARTPRTAAAGVAAARTARVAAAGVAAGVAVRRSGRSRLFLHTAGGFLRTALLLLGDQLSQLRLGFGARLGVLGGELVGLLLALDQRSRELLGLRPFPVERVALVVDVVDERVEFVGGHVAGAEGRLGERFPLERVVEVGRVLEQRAEWGRAATDEGTQRHLAQVRAKAGDLRLLLGDACFGIGDLDVELALGVDGVVVVLTEHECSLLEPLEFVDDVLDPVALLVDGLRLGGAGRHGRHEQGDGDRHGEEESTGHSACEPSECDERVANA